MLRLLIWDDLDTLLLFFWIFKRYSRNGVHEQ